MRSLIREENFNPMKKVVDRAILECVGFVILMHSQEMRRQMISLEASMTLTLLYGVNSALYKNNDHQFY